MQTVADAGEASVETAIELVPFGGYRVQEVPAPGLRGGEPGWVLGGMMKRCVEGDDTRHPVVEVEPDRFRLPGIGGVAHPMLRLLAARFNPASRAESQVEVRLRGPPPEAEHLGVERGGEAKGSGSGSGGRSG